jgi:hypothetical protein
MPPKIPSADARSRKENSPLVGAARKGDDPVDHTAFQPFPQVADIKTDRSVSKNTIANIHIRSRIIIVIITIM